MVFQLREYGIEGPSWLSTISHYGFIEGTSIDYMHCVLLDVCKQVIKLWMQSKYHKELWYIGTTPLISTNAYWESNHPVQFSDLHVVRNHSSTGKEKNIRT